MSRSQDTSSEQLEASFSVHRSLDQLETVHLPFDLSIAPREENRREHGVFIAPEPSGKRPKLAVLSNIEPRCERIRVVCIEHAEKFLRECVHTSKHGRCITDRLDVVQFWQLESLQWSSQQPRCTTR